MHQPLEWSHSAHKPGKNVFWEIQIGIYWIKFEIKLETLKRLKYTMFFSFKLYESQLKIPVQSFPSIKFEKDQYIDMLKSFPCCVFAR